MRYVDVVIVGGGVTGLTTAIHLRELGVARVLILERHHIGAGQSGRAAGIVRSLVGNQAVVKMLRSSIDFFTTFSKRYRTKIQAHRIGYLLINQAHARQELAGVVANAAAAGCGAALINASDALDLQPGLGVTDDDVLAYEPEAIYVDPMAAVHALSIVARKMGVHIEEGCEVTRIKVNGEGLEGVVTTQGDIHCERALVGAGAWGAGLLAHSKTEVPVYPHRVEMAFFEAPLESPLRLKRIVSDARTMLYMRPEGLGQMFVGWREGDRIKSLADLQTADPDNYRQTSNYPSLMEMYRQLKRTLPFMTDGFIHRTYACVYDYTADAMPILDRVPGIDGLFFALGFSGGGFSLSPWVGQAMAQFIATAQKTPELRMLSADRFSENRPVHWSNVGPGANRETELAEINGDGETAGSPPRVR